VCWDVLKEIGRFTVRWQAYASQTLNIQQNFNFANTPEFIDLQMACCRCARRIPEARADIVSVVPAARRQHARKLF